MKRCQQTRHTRRVMVERVEAESRMETDDLVVAEMYL